MRSWKQPDAFHFRDSEEEIDKSIYPSELVMQQRRLYASSPLLWFAEPGSCECKGLSPYPAPVCVDFIRGTELPIMNDTLMELLHFNLTYRMCFNSQRRYRSRLEIRRRRSWCSTHKGGHSCQRWSRTVSSGFWTNGTRLVDRTPNSNARSRASGHFQATF